VRALIEVAASPAPLAVWVTVTSSAWSATMSSTPSTSGPPVGPTASCTEQQFREGPREDGPRFAADRLAVQYQRCEVLDQCHVAGTGVVDRDSRGVAAVDHRLAFVALVVIVVFVVIVTAALQTADHLRGVVPAAGGHRDRDRFARHDVAVSDHVEAAGEDLVVVRTVHNAGPGDIERQRVVHVPREGVVAGR